MSMNIKSIGCVELGYSGDDMAEIVVVPGQYGDEYKVAYHDEGPNGSLADISDLFVGLNAELTKSMIHQLSQIIK
jgi:hypothetical protein